ncbi:hypothetical protein ACNKF0_09745 [Nocardioides sp. T5]|uniref:hypothetical protein n=1 Tax=Nocardioides sp. T5 TaxID=3400182 RepID=UPI003A854DD2
MFTPAPEQWGLRGDRYLWQALREALDETPVPATDDGVDNLLATHIEDLAGVDIRREVQEAVYREQFAHGGMSSGHIHVPTWRDRLLPLLVARAAGTRVPDPWDRQVSVDLRATRSRIARLNRYVESNLLSDGQFICPSYQQCRNSRHQGGAFREGIMSHVGRRFDLTLDGEPLRIAVVGQESGLAKGPSAARYLSGVTMETRYQQVVNGSGLAHRYYAQDGYPGRNPHMRGTTTALRLLLGTGLGTDYEGEFVLPTKGRRFHLFDGFALVNRLLCSAGPPGGSQGRPTGTMARNCGAHFSATLSILEPTIVILQGTKVAKWATGVLAPERVHTEHLYEAILDGRRVVVCRFSHPSAHGTIRWGDRPDAPYVANVVAPTLQAALQLSLQT